MIGGALTIWRSAPVTGSGEDLILLLINIAALLMVALLIREKW